MHSQLSACGVISLGALFKYSPTASTFRRHCKHKPHLHRPMQPREPTARTYACHTAIFNNDICDLQNFAGILGISKRLCGPVCRSNMPELSRLGNTFVAQASRIETVLCDFHLLAHISWRRNVRKPLQEVAFYQGRGSDRILRQNGRERSADMLVTASD